MKDARGEDLTWDIELDYDNWINEVSEPMSERWDDDVAIEAIIPRFTEHYGELDQLIHEQDWDGGEKDALVKIVFNRLTDKWLILTTGNAEAADD